MLNVLPMIDTKTLRAKSREELTSFINEQRTIVSSYRFGLSGGDVKTYRAAKKNIARALTMLATSETTSPTNT